MASSDLGVDPQWLTAVLRESGALTRGRVVGLDVEPMSARNSLTVQLRATFDGAAPDDAPAELVLKRNASAAWSVQAGQSEVAFYRLVAGLRDHPAGIVPCLGCGIDDVSGDSFVLLADLSTSHEVVVPHEVQIAMTHGIPADWQIVGVVDTLARIQAFWWERVTEPFEVAGWCRDAAQFGGFLQRRNNAWGQMSADHGSWLPSDVRELFEYILPRLPGYWERELRDRMLKRQQLTLVHGDAYFENFLCPRVPGAGPTYLIDWQSPSFDVGAGDLVNLCATWWTSEQRNERRREERILLRYHDQLIAGGVMDYTYDDLRADYARALIDWVLVPVQDAANGSSLDYWWPKMQCLISAFRDWNCVSLLAP